MSTRTYVVGLPVIVTVCEDGTVAYEIDTAEAGSAIREDDGSAYTDDETEHDAIVCAMAHEAFGNAQGRHITTEGK